MLLDRSDRRWAAGVAACSIAAIAWSLRDGEGKSQQLVFGLAAGAIIVFEILLWPRGKLRALRIGHAQTWMRAHIWLGAFCVVPAVLHTQFRAGGALTTTLVILLFLVVGSGIFGLALQHFLPRKMLDEVPAETIFSQIGHVSRLACLSAEELVLSACGPDPAGRALGFDGEAAMNEGRGYVTIGAVRSSGHLQGKVLQRQRFGEVIEHSDLLRDMFYSTIAPYLECGNKSGSTLSRPHHSRQFFDLLQSRLSPAIKPVVDSLKELCDQRRQWDRQASMHVWLHAWLTVHVPLSVSLTILTLTHAWIALKGLH
jgi:hypothetical protein